MNQLESTVIRQQQRLVGAMDRLLSKNMERLDRTMMNKVWRDPLQLVKQREERLRQVGLRLDKTMKGLFEQRSANLALLTARLDGMSPLKTMQRGYAMVRSGQRIISRGEQVEIGDRLQVCLENADLSVEVRAKEAVSRWRG